MLKNVLNRNKDDEPDPDDELKGYILRFLHKYTKIEDILPFIAPSKNDSFIGGYSSFLTYELPKNIKNEELVSVVEWIGSNAHKWVSNSDINRFRSNMIHLTYKNISEFKNIEFLAITLIQLMNNHITIKDSLDEDQKLILPANIRRKLLRSIIKNESLFDKRGYYYSFTHYGLYENDDFEWLYEQSIESRTKNNEKKFIVELLRTVFNPYQQTNQFNLVIDNPKKSKLVDKAFSFLTKVMQFDDPETIKIKEDYYRYEKPERKNKAELHPPVEQMVQSELKNIRVGKVINWWLLVRILCLSPDSNEIRWNYEFNLDVDTLPGWGNLKETTKNECINAAKKYLLEIKINPNTWFCKDVFHRPASAGLKAFVLINKFDKPWLKTNEIEIAWDNWLPALLDFHGNDINEDSEKYLRELLGVAYKYHPVKLINKLKVLVFKSNSEHGLYNIKNVTNNIRDKRLGNFLNKILLEENILTPKSKGDLLELLFLIDAKKAKKVANELIENYGELNEFTAYKKEICVSLIMSDASSAFETLYAFLNENKEFGKELLLLYFSMNRSDIENNFNMAMSEVDIKNMFIWLSENMDNQKHKENKKRAYWVGSEDRIYNYTNGLINQLKMRGTIESLDVLKELIDRYPEEYYLKYVLIEANENMLINTWASISPQELYSLSSDNDKRIVNSNYQLLETICNSLESYQSELNTDLLEINNLWNDDGFPKNENHLSNNVAKYLRNYFSNKNIIVNREVQIQSGATDIKIEALCEKVGQERFQTLNTVIEVKGCWNKDLKTSMSDQLKNKYMSAYGINHGVYLVGWFLSDYWNESDYRKKATPKWDIENAKQYFKSQSDDLSDSKNLIKSFVLDLRKVK